MKSILSLLLTAALGTSLSAQEPDCWHYEDGDAPIVGSVDTPGSCSDVVIVGNIAYVGAYFGHPTWDGILYVVDDLSDPENPSVMGSVNTPGGVLGVAVSDNYAYAAQIPNGQDGALCVVDVGTPENPWIVSNIDLPDRARDVAVSGSYAYVADTEAGLIIVDIVNPENPLVVGIADTPDRAMGVAVSGSLAYVADDDSGLQIVNLSDPKNPWIIGSEDTPVTALDLVVRGNYAYIAAGNVWGALWIADISNPENPQIVGSCPRGSGAYCVAVEGDFAYGLGYDLTVVNIGVPENPWVIGSVDTGYSIHGVAVSGNYVYCAQQTGSLQIAWRQCGDEGPPHCMITPPSWDFGNVFAESPAEQTFEVRNTGGGQLEGQVTVPALCAGFTMIDGGEPFSLAYDETHSFTIEFDPIEEGSQLCNVSVSVDCADVELIAEGYVFPECVITPPSWDFGYVWVGAPTQQTFEVRNAGGSQLEGQALIPASCTDYSIVDGGEPFSLLHDESQYFTVEFAPDEEGPQQCNVFVSTDCSEVELVAEAVVSPLCVITPPEWDFGIVCEGEPIQQTFEVWNAGGPQLEGQVMIPETCSGFTLSEGAEPFSLAHDESHLFTIVFDPVEGGPQECSVFVSTDCSDVELFSYGITNAWNSELVPLSQMRGISVYVGWDGPGVSEDAFAHEFDCFSDTVHVEAPFLGIATASQTSGFVAGGFKAVGVVQTWINGESFGGEATSSSHFTYEFAITGLMDYALSGYIEALGDYDECHTTLTMDGPSGAVLNIEVAGGDTEEVSESGLLAAGTYTFNVVASTSVVGDVFSHSASAAFDLELELGALTAAPDAMIQRVALHGAVPNPFNPQTTITFSLPRIERAKISVYDLTGRIVSILADRTYPVGDHSVVWNGKDAAGREVSSGTYIVRLETETGVEARKVMLVR